MVLFESWSLGLKPLDDVPYEEVVAYVATWVAKALKHARYLLHTGFRQDIQGLLPSPTPRDPKGNLSPDGSMLV